MTVSHDTLKWRSTRHRSQFCRSGRCIRGEQSGVYTMREEVIREEKRREQCVSSHLDHIVGAGAEDVLCTCRCTADLLLVGFRKTQQQRLQVTFTCCVLRFHHLEASHSAVSTFSARRTAKPCIYISYVYI